MSKCSACQAEWSGLARCHCSSCHETFNSPAAFDKHRRALKCVAPEKAGMVRNESGYWVTGLMEPEQQGAKLGRLFKKLRSGG